MGLKVLSEVRTLEKKGVLAPRLMLRTILEQVSSFFCQQIVVLDKFYDLFLISIIRISTIFLETIYLRF